MRILLTILAGLVVLVGGLALALPYVVPHVWLRATLTETLAEATGAEVRIEGELRWRVLPRMAARVERVGFGDLPERSPLERLTVATLDAELGLIDLIWGNVVVRRLVVGGLDAVVDLDRVRPEDLADELPDAPAEGGRTPTAGEVPSVVLDEVRLEAARIVLREGGRERRLEDLDGQLAWPDPAGPIAIALDGRLDDRPLLVRLDAAAPRALLGSGTSDVRLHVEADGLTLTLDGDADLVPRPSARASLDVDLDQPAATLSWLAGTTVDLPFERLTASARIDGNGDALTFDDLDLRVDEATATGALALRLDGARPQLGGSLRLGTLDLAWLRADAEEDANGDAAAAAEAAASVRTAVQAPVLPLDLDLAVAVDTIRAEGLEIGPASMTLLGRDGGLDVDLDELALYGGSIDGTVGYRPEAGAMQLATALRGQGIDLAALLHALDVDEMTAGTASFRLDLDTSGTEADDLLAADGSGDVRLERVRLQRLDDHPQLRALRELLILGGGSGEITVGSATASFTVRNGIVRNDDLVAATGVLRLRGEGTADLPGRRVPRYVLTPEPLTDVDRLGPVQHLRVVMVPVVIDGPFDDLRVRADPGAAVTGPLRELRRLLEGSSEGEEEGESGLERGVRDVLRGFGIRP